MQNESWLSTCFLRFWFFENFENWGNNHQQILLSIFFKIFFYFRKSEHVYKNTSWWIVCVRNFKSPSLKTAEFCHFECPKRPLFTLQGLGTTISAFFGVSIFVQFGPFKNCFTVIFAFFTKIWPKTCIPPSKLEILNLTFSDLVTLDDLHSEQGPQKSSGVSQTRSMSFNRLYFNMTWLLCPAKPARSENQEFYIYTDLWRH